MIGEQKVIIEIVRFVRSGIQNIKELTADELIEESAINPFLVKALGIGDFDSLARFYVYQRVGRGLVTGFGTTLERTVRALSDDEKPVWWDAKKKIGDLTYYMSVKSGPRDMNKDQVQLFAERAKEVMKKDPTALPVIAMAYGRLPMGVIEPTLRGEGLDPRRHTLTGKQLYQTLSGRTDYHVKSLELIGRVAFEALGNKKFIDLIEGKIREVAEDFKNKYRDVDDLLLKMF